MPRCLGSYAFLLDGINWISLCKMCEEAGIGKKSNHSLRMTGATRLFRSEVAERTIQARTGHKSISTACV